MRFLSLAGAVAWSALSIQYVSALSNITFYSDSACTKFKGWKTGPDDGTCTQFPTNIQGYLSYMVSSLDQTCAVTVYGSDVAFCSSTTLFIAPFSNCMPAMNVSQFSVDCQDLSVATSAVPSVVPTGAANPVGSTSNSTSSTSDTGLSGGAKAGIAVAAAVVGLGLVALLVFVVARNTRKKRADMEARNAQEADSRPLAPPYMEMPQNEKKSAMEMHAAVPQEIASSIMAPVEAPGDDHWGPRQELPGDYTPSEVEGSTVPHQKADASTAVSSGNTTVVGSEGGPNSKRHSRAFGDSQP